MLLGFLRANHLNETFISSGCFEELSPSSFYSIFLGLSNEVSCTRNGSGFIELYCSKMDSSAFLVPR